MAVDFDDVRGAVAAGVAVFSSSVTATEEGPDLEKGCGGTSGSKDCMNREVEGRS